MATARALACSSGGSRRPTALPAVHDPRLAAALSSRPCLRPAANCQRPAASLARRARHAASARWVERAVALPGTLAATET